MIAEFPEGAREAAAAGALAPLARSGPSPLLTLTDEEMLVLYGNTGEGQFASPWLDRLAADRGERFDVGMLMAAARRSMLARGIVAPEVVLAAAEKRAVKGEPQGMRANLLVTGILVRRDHAAMRLEAFSDALAERGTHHVFVDRDGTVLHEQTSPNGLHHFMMQGVPESVDLLRSFVLGKQMEDSEASSSDVDGETTPVWRGRKDSAAADPALLERTGALVAETRMTLSGRTSTVHGEIHLISGRDALVILQPDLETTEGEEMATAREVTPDELEGMLTELVGDGVEGGPDGLG